MPDMGGRGFTLGAIFIFEECSNRVAPMRGLLLAFLTLAGCVANRPPVVSDSAVAAAPVEFNGYEIKNSQSYGNCSVNTLVDIFTDKERHQVHCYERKRAYELAYELNSKRREGISISKFSSSRNILIRLDSGPQPLWPKERIPVAIRIDEGPLIERAGSWMPEYSESVTITDRQFTYSLLRDLAQGTRLAVQVGTVRYRIRLNGAREAVADFLRRTDLVSKPCPPPRNSDCW